MREIIFVKGIHLFVKWNLYTEIASLVFVLVCVYAYAFAPRLIRIYIKFLSLQISSRLLKYLHWGVVVDKIVAMSSLADRRLLL